MSAPRIGVNLLWLVPGVVGGSEESTMRALRAVVRPAAEAGIEVVLFALPDLCRAHPEVTSRFSVVAAPVDGFNKPRRVLSENTWLRAARRDHRIDLMHHAGGVVPPTSPRPCTVTIHDLQPLDLPENFSSTKRNYLRSVLTLSTKRACRVGVPSQFTKDRVANRLGVDPARIDVIPWSVPVQPVRVPEASDGPDGADPVAALGVGPRFLLYPAVTYPHKNHLRLIDAFDDLADADPTIELVLCGGSASNETAVRGRIMKSPAALRIHRLGRVPDATLEALYRRATALVWPSEYEGFGLPPLEAMAYGCPVVASDIPVLAEVVGDAAIVVPPDDRPGWVAALRTVTSDHQRREALVVAGRERAASFSPDRTARALIDMWLHALDHTGQPSAASPEATA